MLVEAEPYRTPAHCAAERRFRARRATLRPPPYRGIDRGLRLFGKPGQKTADLLFAGVRSLGGKIASVPAPVVHRIARAVGPQHAADPRALGHRPILPAAPRGHGCAGVHQLAAVIVSITSGIEKTFDALQGARPRPQPLYAASSRPSWLDEDDDYHDSR
ncbi:MAG: hypothetical protein NVS3B26_26540 [Mycobacteriales bacterium]